MIEIPLNPRKPKKQEEAPQDDTASKRKKKLQGGKESLEKKMVSTKTKEIETEEPSEEGRCS